MRTTSLQLGSPRTRWIIALACVLFLVLASVVWRMWPRAAGNASRPPPRPIHLLVSGDTAGWIIPCGCTSNQSGGLLRRGTYVQQVRERAELIVVDAGGAPAGTAPYQRHKFEAILQGERAMGVAAHNIGGPEAALGVDYLRDVARRLDVPLVSANLRDANDELVAAALRTIEVNGRRLAITGVLSPRHARDGMRISDPKEAVLASRSSASQPIDSLVVLAYLPEDELVELTAALPEADVVVGGPTGQSIQPRLIGPTLVASATNKGKFLVHLEAPDPGGRWTGRVVEMGPELADHSAQVENLRLFRAALAERDFAAGDTGLVAELPVALPPDYAVAGSQSCRECHNSDCRLWAESRHRHAWETLEGRGSHVDPFCQQCHTTGYGLPGGFVSVRATPKRTAVGCETCHGPALAHRRDSTTRTPFVASDQCIRCHDRENSPTFEFATYWEQIRHGESSASGAADPDSP